MHVTFLGGAAGIGGSCLLVYLGQHWFLIDAGIRMDATADRLPDLAALQDKPLAAIFVTHAHADHIGALPLVQQEFPAVPIYASRGTMLLMDVMLHDSLSVMAKRATSAAEVPLYDEPMVAATLDRLRPLPLSGSTSVPELPGITITTARAGHVAGAISLGFAAPDGRLLVSGDVSITPQRTVPGAEVPALPHPDLLVLESTYGSRLHPNRQTEESRLAQAVAEGIQRGGHVLVPAFALGRAQEVIRILALAQQQRHIPDFPVRVDGLVRRVCSSYAAMPDALTNALQRQLRKGYDPFFTQTVQPVTEARQRDKLLGGEPACIVTSSGMLTGGPSAYYAAQLAPHPHHAILITGYQDEESPGRKLLALADAGGNGELDLGEQTVPVRCQFGKYSLSAHADGSELAAYVSQVRPRQVALVHGDPAARDALGQRLERLTSVVLPADGETLTVTPAPRRRTQAKKADGAPAPTSVQTTAVGQGKPLDTAGLPHLWAVFSSDSPDQVRSVRELALAWYGDALTTQAVDTVAQVLATEPTYFVPLPDAPDLVRVRTAAELEPAPTQTQQVRPGMLLLLTLPDAPLVPAIALDVTSQAVGVVLPSGTSRRRSVAPTAVQEVLGRVPAYPFPSRQQARQALTALSHAARSWQRQQVLTERLGQLDPAQSYAFAELCERLEIAADDLAARLGLAWWLHDTPQVFAREEAEGKTPRYRLQPDALTHAATLLAPPPDQQAILGSVDRHLGDPPDLRKRSIDPQTGAVTLVFDFPTVAQEQYGEAIAAAAQEAGVPISIDPQARQQALVAAAEALLPAEVAVEKASVYLDQQRVVIKANAAPDAATMQTIQQQFAARTGWQMTVQAPGAAAAAKRPPTAPAPDRLDQHQAQTLVRTTLPADAGCYKVSVDASAGVLTVRVHFPDMARERYADDLARLEAQTGWHIRLHPEPHQGKLREAVRSALPPSVDVLGTPSLLLDQRQIAVRVRGDLPADQEQQATATVAATTGWSLVVRRAG